MIRIITCLGLLVMAGCGWEWFPSQTTSFTNTSTAKRVVTGFTTSSTATMPAPNAVNYSTAGRPETAPEAGAEEPK